MNPSNFLFTLIGIFFFLFFITKKKIFFKYLAINFFIILFISFIPIGNMGLKYLEKDFFNEKKYKNIKNIVVLSGSDERIIESIKLANTYNNSKIFYVGGDGYMIKSNQNDENNNAKELYSSINFDLNRVYFIGNSRNTIENFAEIKKLNLKGLETILVTSAYHMKRALMIASSENLNFMPFAIDFKSFTQESILNKYQAFSVTKNLSNFNLCFREILGIIAFKFST